jgi:LmbE family N-acetylglucosaminyl deacetylase
MTTDPNPPEPKATLLAVLAHPDDESFATGGTLAHYAQRGMSVHLVCATGGDAGTIADDGLQGYESLTERRLSELCCAAQELGLASVNLLGYRDSGMAGSEDNQNPQALINAHLDEVTQKIICYIRQYRPQVVITHDPIGGYRHPDHIAVHQAAVRAFYLAGDDDGGTGEDGLPPYKPAKLYYNIMPRGFLRFMVRVLKLLGKDVKHFGRNGDIDLEAIAAVEFPTHASINYRSVTAARDQASACHASQGGRSLTGGVLGWFRRVFMPYEIFTQAYPPFEGERPAKDLFAGL